MSKIICQACTPSSREVDGCSICGGYGNVLEEIHCPSCGVVAWVRPGVYTSYEGKQWHSFDGLLFVDHGTGRKCIYCEEKKQKAL